jgi:hypothetical protein
LPVFGLGEGFVDAFEVWIEADGDEGRHEQRVAQFGPSTVDETLAAPFPAVTGHGREACETDGALVVDRAELGHVDQHGERGRLAQPWEWT